MISKLLSFQTNRIVSIVQLVTKQVNSFNYISGSVAIKKGLIEVKEVNDSGSVNNLFVINHSDQYVFFSDGDILSGAKQNRVLNTSILLSPHSKTTIPVSCVEQGRWQHISPKFKSTDYVAPSYMRAKKATSVKDSLKTKRGYYAEQGMIWDDVNKYQKTYNLDSATDNLSHLYDTNQKAFDEFLSKFKINPIANGIAAFINKQLLVVDIFNRNEIYHEYFNKLLRGVAVEAFYLKPQQVPLEEPEAFYKTNTFFDELEKLKYIENPGIGVGREKRFDSKTIGGFELIFNEHLIHLTAMHINTEIN